MSTNTPYIDAPFAMPTINAQPGPRQDRERLTRWMYRGDGLYDLVCANPTAFTRLMRRQREALGLSQRGVSRMCGLSTMGINAIERGLYLPSRDVLALVLTELGLTRDDILAEIRAMQDEEAVDAQAA